MKSMRLEYKYLIPKPKLNDLREALIPFVNVDEYAQSRSQKEYTVRSIYFDTMRLDDYQDKLAGLKIRKKIRIRAYNELEEDSLVFLEVKRKYENHISKNRSPLLYYDLDQIFQSGDVDNFLIKKKNYLDERNDALKFLYLLKIKNCSPVVNVVYEREAFFSKHDSTLRITFDKNLRSLALPKLSNLYKEFGLQRAMRGYFILEIKFYNGFPQWLQNILGKFATARRALSKYTVCVDNHGIFNRHISDNKLLIPSLLNGFNINYQRDSVKNVE